MVDHTVHDLTPGYALDALDETERGEYLVHLTTCDRCRIELAELQEIAASLAYAVDAPAPPPELRERIVAQARAERGNVLPFRRRRLEYGLGAVAAVAASVAIALGIWGVSVAQERDDWRTLAADPDTRVLDLPARNGRLLIAPDGDATLVVDGRPAPAGKDYELWVIQDGRASPAGIFDGGREVVRLTRPVPPGASVAMTLERDGGVDAPTTKPLFVVES